MGPCNPTIISITQFFPPFSPLSEGGSDSFKFAGTSAEVGITFLQLTGGFRRLFGAVGFEKRKYSPYVVFSRLRPVLCSK